MKNYKIDNTDENSEDLIRKFILDDHPCVMAQSLVADENLTISDYKNIQNHETPSRILEDLKTYLESIDEEDKKFQTFIATFENDTYSSEITFEKDLWELLKKLNTIDPEPWDKKTSADPSSSKFSFSLLSNSFYIVGMHPKSSRKARRAPFPMIVFNLHSQFDLLRDAGRYTRVRDIIRRRDKAFQGSINPMLEDFGTNSEARQYSGRKVSEHWKCPYNFDKH